jgi:hypothetical protein
MHRLPVIISAILAPFNTLTLTEYQQKRRGKRKKPSVPGLFYRTSFGDDRFPMSLVAHKAHCQGRHQIPIVGAIFGRGYEPRNPRPAAHRPDREGPGLEGAPSRLMPRSEERHPQVEQCNSRCPPGETREQIKSPMLN